MSKAPPVYPRHLARLKQFRDSGDLLLVGTFGDPQAEGSTERAFANRYWPAVYLADAEGRIRYHHLGEGD